jgi:heat shock protein HslJ
MLMQLLRITFLSFPLSLSLLGACHTSHPQASEASQKPTASLRNTRWVLRTLAGAPISTPENSREMYVQFEATTNRVKGQAACNGFFGQFALTEPTTLQLSNLGATRMSCDRIALETQFLQALQQTSRFQIKGDTLHLYTGSDDQPFAVFEAIYLP